MRWVAFEHKLPCRSVVHVMIGKRPEAIVFIKHIYMTNNPDIIDGLMNHAQYGKNFKAIETADEYQRVKEHGKLRDTHYMRGPSATVEPRKTQVVTDPVDTVSDDDTTVEEIAKTGPSAAAKSAKRMSKKRSKK